MNHMHKIITAIITAIIILTAFNIFHQQPFQPQIPPDLQFKQINIAFQEWMVSYGKIYPTSEIKIYRRSIWKNNYDQIQSHNKQQLIKYRQKANQFTDLNLEEFLSRFSIGKKHHLRIDRNFNMTLSCSGNISIAPNPPKSLDWSTKVVTSVKNQGQCGSNWAITAIGAIQGLYALKMSNLTQLSDQQLVDCSGDYGNQGCHGGFMDQAFWYMIDYGVATRKQYPTTTSAGKCRYTPVQKFTKFSKCARVTSMNHTKLLSAVVQQPTSVAIDASEIEFYSGGIFNESCGTDLNMGFLLVGYGQSNGTPYWKLKSALGTDWGINGYLLLEKDDKDDAGKCGIRLAASVPQQLL